MIRISDRDIAIKSLWESGEYTLEKIASKYNVSRERIRQILVKLHAKSSHELRAPKIQALREKINAPEFIRLSTKDIATILDLPISRVMVYRDHKPFKYEDIWLYIDVGKPEECWNWLGGKCHQGFGAVHRKKHYDLVHRVVWEAKVGKIPERKVVLHTCGNKICCNPAHLYLGNLGDVFHPKRKEIR